MTKNELLAVIKDIKVSELIEILPMLRQLVAFAECFGEMPRPMFNVYLTGIGTQKIEVIKAIREVTSMGLKESKDLTEGMLPAPVISVVTAEQAKIIKDKFVSVGAIVGIEVS